MAFQGFAVEKTKKGFLFEERVCHINREQRKGKEERWCRHWLHLTGSCSTGPPWYPTDSETGRRQNKLHWLRRFHGRIDLGASQSIFILFSLTYLVSSIRSTLSFNLISWDRYSGGSASDYSRLLNLWVLVVLKRDEEEEADKEFCTFPIWELPEGYSQRLRSD